MARRKKTVLFVLSKLFWILFQPLALSFVLATLALFSIVFSQTGLAAGFIALAAVLLFVALFTNVGEVLLYDLESRFHRVEPVTPPECAIILGGGINTGMSAARGTYVITRAADRYIEALRLARISPEMLILVTGGDNSLSGNINGEAEPAARFFADHGIDPRRILYEPKARNTAENAANTALLLKEKRLAGPCLLVTSAYHMPRSVALFDGVNLDVTPWPVDYRTDGGKRLHLSLDRPSTNAAMLSTALREWAGLISSRLIGRTTLLVPKQKN